VVSRLRSFLRALFGRGRFEDGMTDELRFHIDAYAADLERQGLSAAEASRRARAAFGSLDSAREDCRRARGLRFLDRLRQDLRYSARLMRRSPGFTAAALLSLGLGIGANTAIFSLIDAVLLRSLPVAQPEQLFFLAHGQGDRPQTSSNYPLFDRYRTTEVFSGVTAFRAATLKVQHGTVTELLPAQFVSGNYHAVIGAPIIHGRGFVSMPDRPTGDEGAAVISEGYWVRRFGRSPDVLGRIVTVQGRPVEIVGVTAAAFGGFEPGAPVEITLPLSMYVLDNPKYLDAHESFTSMSIVARVQHGITEQQALSATDLRYQQFMSEPDNQWARKNQPETYATARLLPAGKGSQRLREQYRTPLLVLMIMAALVLMVTAANIANVLLARSSARAREVAIRLCVGSGRWRVVRQFLTESAVLALAGGVLGILLADWGTELIVAAFGTWRQPLVLDVSLNVRVLAFAATVALVTGIGFGVAPALRATSGDLTPLLKGNDRGGTGSAVRRSVMNRGLIVVQVALCVVVVAIAALLAQSVRNLKARDAGFDPANVVLFDIDAPATLTRALRGSFFTNVLERVRTLPGVTSASASTMTPVGTSGSLRGLALPGLPPTPDARGVWVNGISTRYLETLGVRVLRGRDFADQDMTAASKVVIINERTARYVFGDANPIGRTVAWMSAADQPLEIVGVVENSSLQNLREDAPRMVYTPLGAQPEIPSRVQLAVKTSADMAPDLPTVTSRVRDLVRTAHPDAAIHNVRTMDEQIDGTLVEERALTWLSAGFALLVLSLACVGLYGMMSYHVARRTREIGIRLALGARPEAVLREVLRHTLSLTLLGIALGIAGALAATRIVSTFLFGLSARDPLTLAGVSLALVMTALAAGYLPARRAARIDPLRAIRSE
jgi:predicted permease